MTGPGGAFGLASIQLVAGIFIFMWAASLRYKIVGRGYYRSLVWCLWPLMLAVSFALPGRLRTLGFVTAVVFVMYLVAVYSQRALVEWITGGAGSIAGLALIGLAGWEACAGGCALGAAHGLLGGLVLGGVTHGMTLGHWYLNQARLPIEPLKEQVRVIFGILGLSLIAGVVTRAAILEGEVPGGILNYPSSSYWWTWVLMIGATVFLIFMVRATVRERSTQSATGLLYIAGLTALAGQFLLDLLVTT